ncbi:MAG: type II toxin-antitoxin system HicA family toxin [Desulfomonilaceae bacterium]
MRELIEELQQAGFVDRGGKGSHRNFVHPNVSKPVTVSGKGGDDANYSDSKVRSRILSDRVPEPDAFSGRTGLRAGH